MRKPKFLRRSRFPKRRSRYKKPYFPKLKSGDNLHLFKLQCAITDYFIAIDDVRNKLNRFVYGVGDKKALLNNSKKFMERLDIKKPRNELTQLNMLIHAAYIERVLAIPVLKVEYPILASVPKKNAKEVWDKALLLRNDEEYPTVKEVKEAIKDIKSIKDIKAMRDSNSLDEYIADIL